MLWYFGWFKRWSRGRYKHVCCIRECCILHLYPLQFSGSSGWRRYQQGSARSLGALHSIHHATSVSHRSLPCLAHWITSWFLWSLGNLPCILWIEDSERIRIFSGRNLWVFEHTGKGSVRYHFDYRAYGALLSGLMFCLGLLWIWHIVWAVACEMFWLRGCVCHYFSRMLTVLEHETL